MNFYSFSQKNLTQYALRIRKASCKSAMEDRAQIKTRTKELSQKPTERATCRRAPGQYHKKAGVPRKAFPHGRRWREAPEEGKSRNAPAQHHKKAGAPAMPSPTRGRCPGGADEVEGRRAPPKYGKNDEKCGKTSCLGALQFRPSSVIRRPIAAGCHLPPRGKAFTDALFIKGPSPK